MSNIKISHYGYPCQVSLFKWKKYISQEQEIMRKKEGAQIISGICE